MGEAEGNDENGEKISTEGRERFGRKEGIKGGVGFSLSLLIKGDGGKKRLHVRTTRGGQSERVLGGRGFVCGEEELPRRRMVPGGGGTGGTE